LLTGLCPPGKVTNLYIFVEYGPAGTDEVEDGKVSALVGPVNAAVESAAVGRVPEGAFSMAHGGRKFAAAGLSDDPSVGTSDGGE
jgi:hypothetical protein